MKEIIGKIYCQRQETPNISPAQTHNIIREIVLRKKIRKHTLKKSAKKYPEKNCKITTNDIAVKVVFPIICNRGKNARQIEEK